MKRLLWVLVVFLLAGCGWNESCTKHYTSYTIGKEKAVPVGAEMVQTGSCAVKHYDPTGLNKILWDRQPCDVTNDDPLLFKELIYSGRDGNTLHIIYREYSIGVDRDSQGVRLSSFARPSYFQSAFYDLSESDTVVFQDWTIKVIDANNQEIRFAVQREPAPIGDFF
jgi:hypothetical protein